MKRITIISALIILTTLLSACGAAEAPAVEETPMPPVVAETGIVAEGRLEPAQYASVAFSASGTVDEVFVVEGAQVSEGDVLALLENTEVLEADIARAEAEVAHAETELPTELADAYKALRTAQQRVDTLFLPAKFDGMTSSEAAEAMLVRVNEARDTYEPYFGYDKPRGYVKGLKEELDDAWSYYNQALEWMNREADLEAAKIRLAQAQADYDDFQTGQEVVSTTQSNLSAAKIALSNAELRSPISGTVADLNVKVGESVGAGQSIASVADFSSWLVKTTDLTELDVVNVVEGQTVTVTLDAMPESPMIGTVLFIGHTFSESQGDVVYEVTISLDDTNPAMRWGMTALVEFAE